MTPSDSSSSSSSGTQPSAADDACPYIGPSPSSAEHKKAAEKLEPVRVAVVTVSDTRTPETDTSGGVIKEQLAAEGHQIVHYEIIPDDPRRIRFAFNSLTARDGIDAVIFNGGTGVAPRDGTIDVIAPELEKVLPGFGEIFRMLSFAEVGPPAMLSRAVAGLKRGRVVFCLPGSKNAVTLGVTRLIRPELAHLVWETRR